MAPPPSTPPGGPDAPRAGAQRPGPSPSPPPASSAARQTAAPSTPAPPAVKKGELAIIVKPWALIWLNGKSLGQTPFREAIPAGRYRLRIANDDVGKDETTLVTVNPDQTTTVQRSW
jgi:serine/threonine-protein kinase